MIAIDNYIPEVVEKKYIKVLLELERCSVCDCLMMDVTGLKKVSPKYYKLELVKQLEKAKIQKRSSVYIGSDSWLCEKCAAEDKARFKCALCRQDKKSSEIKQSFGYQPEYLCTSCYATAPAKIWDEKVTQLREAHRWDFE